MSTLSETYYEVAHRAMLDLVRQPREVVYAADPYIAALEAELAEQTKYVHQMEGWLAQVRGRSAHLLADRNKMRWMLDDACDELAAKAGALDWSGCSAQEMRDSLESRWAAREEAGDEPTA